MRNRQVRCRALEARQQAQRRPGQTARLGGVCDLAGEQPRDHPPDRRDAGDLERRPRMAVEHELRLPGRGREAAELGGELALVARRLAVEDRCGG